MSRESLSGGWGSDIVGDIAGNLSGSGVAEDIANSGGGNSLSGFFDTDVGGSVVDGLASSVGSIANSLSSINQYDVQNTGLPFQYNPSMTKRRDRDRMQGRVDKLNAEWQANQDERRKAIEDQKKRTHEYRMQSEAQANENADLTNRFSAAMRMIDNDNKNNAKIEEASQRIFEVADQNEGLKDQIIGNWGV